MSDGMQNQYRISPSQAILQSSTRNQSTSISDISIDALIWTLIDTAFKVVSFWLMILHYLKFNSETFFVPILIA